MNTPFALPSLKRLPTPHKRRSRQQWHALTKASAQRMAHPVRAWMLLTNSMTARLSTRTGKNIEVRVTRNELSHLHLDERELLGECKQQEWVREVGLCSEGGILLAARSVFLSKQLKKTAGLTALGNQALGELLFANGQVAKWTRREYARIGPGSPLYSLVRQSSSIHLRSCWARRTVFLLQGEPLLVTELFMPSMLANLAN